MIGTSLIPRPALAADANQNLSQSQIDDIIAKFAAHEADFSKARDNYTYRQTARIQELDDAGGTTGKWEMVSDIIFNSDGQRTEHVVRSPVPSLHNILLTPEDMEDLRSVQPFVLTTSEVPNYWIRYLGHQQVDEIGCYVFAVKPKKFENGKRYFSGEVWVDDRDLQVVKTYGRGVGVKKRGSDEAYPKFETYREQIDGKYWFPTYTIANDTLHFKDQDVRIKQTVRYEDYKQFKSDVKITFGDAVEEKKDDKKKQ
ncbi:MAG TPA: hypothetical protein VK419_05370 [Bryobacteraceae bacterium]|nr:hypothetical protein [Bryobacteraceae bacterium]